MDTSPISLQGAFDTHIHASPDRVARAQDFLGVARSARKAGMRGLVFKDVGASTVDRAYAATSLGISAWGGVVLDLPVGGLNPRAVAESFARGGRVVWMPVVDARHGVRRVRSGEAHQLVPAATSVEDALTVFGSGAKLTLATREIVRMIAGNDGVLATGHLSPGESLELLAYAAHHGVRRLLVTHPSAPIIGATLVDQREMAALGAFLEHCYAQTTAGLDGLPIGLVAEAIRSIGAAHCIMASDLGQAFNPPPVEGLGLFQSAMSDAGFSIDELDKMLRVNPARLLT